MFVSKYKRQQKIYWQEFLFFALILNKNYFKTSLTINFFKTGLKIYTHYAKMYLNKSAKQMTKGEQLYESFL